MAAKIYTTKDAKIAPLKKKTLAVIGFGSPNKGGKEECHGAPLGAEEIALTRAALKWNHGPFEIPADIYAEWDAKKAGTTIESEWNQRFAAYAKAHPELASEFTRRSKGELPADFSAKAAAYIADVAAKGETIASRKASQNTLNAFGPLPADTMFHDEGLLWMIGAGVPAGMKRPNQVETS